MDVGYIYTISDEDKNISFHLPIHTVNPYSCVRVCVRKTFQNLLKLEKIKKDLEKHI